MPSLMEITLLNKNIYYSNGLNDLGGVNDELDMPNIKDKSQVIRNPGWYLL